MVKAQAFVPCNRLCRRGEALGSQWALCAQSFTQHCRYRGRVPGQDLVQHNSDKEILTASKPRDMSSNHTHGSCRRTHHQESHPHHRGFRQVWTAHVAGHACFMLRAVEL